MKTILFSFIFCLIHVCLTAQPGTLDSSFGVNGKMLDTTLKNPDCTVISVQPDGKILTGGYSDNKTLSGLYIGRYNYDGSIDESFGLNGKVIINNINASTARQPKTIIVQPDNKILVAGYFSPHDEFYSHIGLLRFLPDGTFDSSLGENGFVLTSFSHWDDLISGMVLQPDGKIVVAGNKQTGEDQPGPEFVIRYMPDGTFDKTFGDNGVIFTYFTSNVFVGAIALQTDGKIVTGSVYGASTRQFQLVRYNNNGTLDSSFAANGIARLNPTPQYLPKLNSIAIQNDGKILAAGLYGDASMALARFNANGNVDSSFGNLSGYTYLSEPGVNAEAKNVFFSKEHKIVLTGVYAQTIDKQVATVQYNINGYVDSAFGNNGIVASGFEESFGSLYGSGYGVLQPNGKTIISGFYALDKNAFNYRVGLIRFNGDSTKRQIIINKIKHYISTHNNAEATTSNNNINLYPNPANNIVTINNLDAKTNYELSIINNKGNVVATNQVSNLSSYQFNIQNVSSGVYYVNVVANNKLITTLKFVKQ